MPGVSEIATCPPSPFVVDLSVLPSSTSSSYLSITLPACSIPAPVCKLWYCTTVLFKPLYCKIKHVFIFCLFFMQYLWEKYYKPFIVHYYIADYVNWVPRLTLMDLQTNWTYEHSQNRTHSYLGDLLYLYSHSCFLSITN